MKLEITKACADSLRSFTLNNYGIPVKSTDAHELVAAYLGYASRASLLADKQNSIDHLMDAEIIVLNAPEELIDQRIRALRNLPAGLPSSTILAEGVYAPIVSNEQFSRKIWSDFHPLALALVEERAREFRMFGNNIGEMDWISDIVVKMTEAGVLITVIFDYPKPLRYSKVDITLRRIAGSIGYNKLKVTPTFYNGNTVYPDYRLQYGID